MNVHWPEDYQEKIEAIIGANFNGTHVEILRFDTFKSIGEAKKAIEQIRIMQKQLHQVKIELNNKIKVKKSHHIPNLKRSRGLLAFASTISNNTSDRMIDRYKNVVFNVDRILEKCEYQKNNIEIWIKEQNTTITDWSYDRQAIPEEVQLYVWRRDGGKCVECGSQENLEYDHIIPVTRGGSNTSRNIQLLCESCNRKKSNSIGG